MITDMNDERAPQIPRSYFRFIGSRGGKARTEAQLSAQKANLAKARQARLDRLKAESKPQPQEKQ